MLNKFVFFLKESWLLLVSSVVFGLLLAATQYAWGPRIAQNDVRLFNEQAAVLLPEASNYEPVDAIVLPGKNGKPIRVDVRRGLNGQTTAGWIMVIKGPGFAGEISLIAALDADFKKMNGFNVLSSSETPGFGDKITIKDGFYQAQYKGAPVGEFMLVKVGDSKKIDSEIVAITGATITSQAVVRMMNTYLAPVREQLTQKGLLPEG